MEVKAKLAAGAAKRAEVSNEERLRRTKARYYGFRQIPSASDMAWLFEIARKHIEQEES